MSGEAATELKVHLKIIYYVTKTLKLLHTEHRGSMLHRIIFTSQEGHLRRHLSHFIYHRGKRALCVFLSDTGTWVALILKSGQSDTHRAFYRTWLAIVFTRHI